MNIYKLGLAVTMLSSLSVFAQDGPDQAIDDKAKSIQLNTITTAVPFMMIGPDSRSGGMGELGAGISPDANSIHWNTSKLAFADKDSDISLSYSPWLRRLVKDIHLSYLSGYKKLGKRHSVGGSLRFFSLGNITFTDASNNVIRDFTPSEFALTGSYAFLLHKKLSIGLNGNFVYSNLTGGVNVLGSDTKPAMGGSADISLSYYDKEIKLGKKKAILGIGLTISNIGNKMRYTSSQDVSDFQPTNLRLGFNLDTKLDEHNSIGFGIDVNKLMVPTPFIAVTTDQGDVVYVGETKTDQGPIAGMFTSFGDAPGRVIVNEAGEAITDEADISSDIRYKKEGDIFVKKGSQFGEEIREINVAFGMEYWYNKLFAFRLGYFNEHASKGNRKYMTLGAGVRYKVFGLDFSYLAAFQRNHPLANTIRFTLKFTFDKKSASKTPDEE